MSTPVLRVEGLHRAYGRGPTRFEALKGVDVEVRAGESLAIVGKSGSGKSTLMHLLALLDRPTSGSVELNGLPADRLRGRELNRVRNQTFGFVFQQFFLTPSATVLENVILPLKIAGVGRGERKRRGMAVLEQLGLADKAKNKAIDLSGGQKQRVVIARALVNDPQVIFADEPTGNLDTTTGAAVEDLLFGLNRERGITLVVVTHDEELASRCDRRITVRDGRIEASATAPTAAATAAAPGEPGRPTEGVAA
ncbi:ABC transporter ATP-binding protein [Agromyces kandeliae]|uniref:ATP-binding cassette domain-containing protein n=1 Tax=Agromyces kandeliae TaxID=2666141 RepID=A0A6L5R3W0_9MICO|nr:ABC transporter ATP-binding protein [Agromyces kandeliae]MRX44669.1 ATP-binding cassette domain-containing protein [Agromyces kandeliae]